MERMNGKNEKAKEESLWIRVEYSATMIINKHTDIDFTIAKTKNNFPAFDKFDFQIIST